MAKQLNVNLAMTADTSQAKLQLQQLQRSLTELVNLSNNRAGEGFGITKEIQEASAAAAQLKVQLKAATDINTGKLDLSKFSQQLDQSGMNLTKYQAQLTALGPAGEKAFAALATSISNADARISNANSALSQFATTLKNTARWQISSSVLHGFMGTIQSAYGYAQDLNESLNNIRIVTGQSSDQMAVFAEKANKAAQALNTTTTSYTDAALIFYQQGLNGKEVEERTNAVIKMAQVTGDSATEVSSYMTAIWNNFDDGSESLEHYADVITALGASTASSSAEIAAGLEKFASVAETIGLSYDYSTAALATIVANTRQSADTVGTGLRTIFSRLQGLTLGETLDDGTDLNKYSKALKTVGVDILDASGNMKNMDTILTDLAEKWDNLSQAQQTALAQTVGGVRQYTNLIALMNNWDDMETNLQTAAGSEGSLQNQADIYAESWEAAQKRVRASAEAIYNALLNDDFFIDLNNGFSGFLDIINNTIKGLGGLKGVLLTVGTIITQVYQKEISGMIGSLGTQLMMLTKTGKQHVEDLRREANEKLINNAYNDGTIAGAAKAAGYTAQGAVQQAFLDNAKKMSEEQRNIAQILLDQNKALSEAVIKQSELAKETEKEAVSQKRIFELKTGLGKSDKKGIVDDATNKAKRAGRLANADKALASSAESINFENLNDPRNKSAIKELQASISSLQRGYQDLGMTAKEALGEKAGSALNRMASAFDKDGNLIKTKVEELRQGWAQWTEAFSQGDANYETALNNLAETMSGVSAESIKLGTATEAEVAKFNACKEKAQEMTQQFYQAGQAESNMAGKTGELSNYVDGLKKKFKEMSQGSIGISTALTQISSTLMSAGMAINSVIGLIQVWKDEDADLTTQILTTLTTLGMIAPTIISVAKGFGTAGQAVTIFGVQTSLAMWQVTLIVAAIAGLIAIFAILANAVYKASPEGVFKSAAKAADEAKDAANQVKESYDNLIDSLQNLDDGIEAIEEMTRGTLEWRQAIAESNASLIELLQTYGMLDSANFTTDADGLMHLTDKAREEMTQNAINAVNEANMASYGAQVFANNASSRNQASNAADDLTVLRNYGDGNLHDVLSSNSQLSADVGMAIAKALNSGALTDLNNTSQIENALSSIKGLTDAEKESVARQIAASGELQASMQELSGVVAANTAANDVLNNQIINGKYGNQITNSGLDEKSQAAVSQMAGDQLESLAEDLYNKTYKDKGTLGGGMTDAEVQKLYAEAMGWATDTIDNQSGNKAKYYAKNGKEIGVISDEVARKYLAQQAALEQLGENVQGYIQNVETMVSQGDQIAEGIGNALLSFAGGAGGSFQELTQGELSAVRNSLNAETDEDGTLTSDTFSIGDITVDTAYAQSLGYESVQAYYDAIQNALSSSEETFDIAKLTESWGLEDINGKILNTAGDRLNSLFSENGSLDLSQMTAGAVKTFADGYRKIYEEGGSEALDVVDSLLAASGDKANKVASLMGDVDWSNWDSIQGLSSDIQALGVEFDTGLINQLANATGAVRSFNTEEFVKEISNVQDIISGLSTGDTISAEDYAQLGEGYESFFTLMADGTYKLTGDAEKFYNVVSQNQRSELLKTLQAGKSDLEATQARQAAATSAMGTQDVSTIGNLNLNTENNTYNTRTAQEQLDFIKEMGAATEDQIAVWEAALKDANRDWQSVNVSVLQEISNAATTAAADFNALDSQIEANNQTLLETQQALFTTATSLEELDMAVYQVDQVMGEHDYNAYAAGLMNIASQYENCTTELVAYNEALASGTIEQIKAAESALKLQVEIGELSEKYGLDANEVSSYAKRLAKSFEEAGMSQEEAASAAKTAAVNNTRLDRGLTNLNKNLDDYKKSLKAANKGTAEWSRAMDELKDDLADILGVDASTLTDTFGEATLNSKDLKLALDGDVDAIKRLQEAAAQEMILDIKANLPENEVSNFMSQWDYLKANMAAAIESPGVDQTNLIASFNEMIRAGNMTKEQIETALAGLHVSANVKTTYISQKQQVPLTITETSWLPSGTMTVPIPDGNGGTRNETYTSMRRVTKTYDAGVDEADVVVPQYEIEGTKGSGNSTVAFTAAPPPRASKSATTSGGAGAGGGGGSSSPPKYNEEKHKNTSDEKERYHVIKNQLEDLSSQYENISKAKDKAFGAARLANLNKEISAQKKLTQANKEYLSEIEKYLAEDKAAVRALGADIDANGTITNYDALVQKAVNDYNAAVDAFNRATTDDEGAQKAFEAAQERYDQFMKTISQYEETQDLYKEQMQQVLDDIMTEQSLLLERTQLEVELKINVSEDALEYLEYMMDNIENKAYDCAEAFGYLNGMTQEYFKTAEALEGGLRSLFANQGLTDADFQKLIEGDTATYNKLMDMLSSGGTADLSDGLQQSEIDAAYGFTADDIDTMRDYVSQLIEANQNLQEIRQTVHEQILTVWDEWNEKLDAGIAKIEHLQSITESYQNIIDIVGQKNLGVSNAFMSKMRQQSIDQANDKLEAEKARYESLKKARDDAYAKFEEQKAKGILSPEEIKQWEDSLAQMDEDVQSASESFQSAWEDALTAANEAFEAAVDQIMQAYDDAAAGLMGSMSDLQDAFDRKSDLSSQYLADYEKIYQLTKLNRDLENSIDSTSNTKAKAELLELQSKINAYEEAGIDISEYQMEQLRQEYELKKAQIELEESQEAKSQVQMTRDADGNYSYVYTANADDVANAEQNYEDKLHQMQESNANYINNLQSNMIQMEQDYQDKVQEIMKDTSLTAEERMVKLNELNQYYDEKMKFYMSEAELWEENSQRLYEEDWMNYAAATGYKISSEEEWLDHWNETQLSILTGFGSLEEYQTNHNMNVANLLLSSSDAFATWQTNIETAMQNAGTSMADFEEDATDVLGTVAEESEKTKDSVVNMAEEATNAIGEVVNAVVDWENQYSATVQKMLTWNNALITSFNKLIAGWSAVQSSANSSGAGSGSGNGSGGSSGSGSNGGNGFNSSSGNSNGFNGGSGVDNSDKVAGVAAAIWLDGDASGWGNNPTRTSRLKEKGVEGAQAYINAHGANGDIYADWASKKGQLRKYYYGSFDTGGYTGEWGLDGKFAMLHEKELVLNKDDTTHFLQAIDIVRQISELIDLNALSSAGGLSSLLAATASSSSQKLEQQVTIHAEFPNVTDKDQITEAFTDLVNLAS